ncbi:MAG TPA: metal ABC transporter permease, partial [Azonexus sp.]|nr:metal ABC transporter permease [Azonexus sp.]
MLARGIIFLDLAIAQIAVLGVIAAHTLGWETQGWQTQLAAASAALAGAAFLAWCEARWPDIQEALIGSSFAVAASLAVLLLSGDPHGGEHLSELLTGQILWVDASQL